MDEKELKSENLKILMDQIKQDQQKLIAQQMMKKFSSIGGNLAQPNGAIQNQILPRNNGLSGNLTYNGIGTTWTESGSYTSDSEMVRIRKDLDLIKKRLMILEPNLMKIAKFQALADAYEHYLCMEKLCDEDMPGAQDGQ